MPPLSPLELEIFKRTWHQFVSWNAPLENWKPDATPAELESILGTPLFNDLKILASNPAPEGAPSEFRSDARRRVLSLLDEWSEERMLLTVLEAYRRQGEQLDPVSTCLDLHSWWLLMYRGQDANKYLGSKPLAYFFESRFVRAIRLGFRNAGWTLDYHIPSSGVFNKQTPFNLTEKTMEISGYYLGVLAQIYRYPQWAIVKQAQEFNPDKGDPWGLLFTAIMNQTKDLLAKKVPDGIQGIHVIDLVRDQLETEGLQVHEGPDEEEGSTDEKLSSLAYRFSLLPRLDPKEDCPEVDDILDFFNMVFEDEKVSKALFFLLNAPVWVQISSILELVAFDLGTGETELLDFLRAKENRFAWSETVIGLLDMKVGQVRNDMLRHKAELAKDEDFQEPEINLASKEDKETGRKSYLVGHLEEEIKKHDTKSALWKFWMILLLEERLAKFKKRRAREFADQVSPDTFSRNEWESVAQLANVEIKSLKRLQKDLDWVLKQIETKKNSNPDFRECLARMARYMTGDDDHE